MSYTSALCSCLICHQVKSVKGIHSHHITKHTTAGNARVKKHGAIKSKAKDDAIEKARLANAVIKKNYELSPNKCKRCFAALPFATRTTKFCSHSCSATANNSKRTLTETTKTKIANTLTGKIRGSRVTPIRLCLFCKKYFPGTNKTCSKHCHSSTMSTNAYKNNLGKDGVRASKNEYRLDSFGVTVRLESSYESKLAQILDSLNIKWSRPGHLNWIDSNNVKHRYYADFYLNDYNLYLDPKNNFLIEKDKVKIQQVIIQNKVIVIVLPIQSLTSETIKQIVQQSGIEPDPSIFQTDVQTTYTIVEQ